MARQNRLPSEWRIYRFGEICTRIERKILLDDITTYTRVGVRWYGLGAFVRDRVSGFDIERKQQWIIKKNDIVYNKLFAWRGAFAIADSFVDGNIVSDKFPTYQANTDVVDLGYLRYYFQMPQLAKQAETLSKGAAAISKLTLNPPQFWDLEIPLPPIDEQRRIVARIEQLAAKVVQAQVLRRRSDTRTEVLFESCLEPIVSGLQKTYPIHCLIDLVEPERGISYGVVQTGKPHEYGIPTLRAGDLAKFRVKLDSVKLIDPKIEAQYHRTRLRGNELLLRIRGGYGELAVCPPEMSNGNVSREIAVIPFRDDVMSKYGMYILAAPQYQQRMKANLRGTSYVGINLGDVRKLAIPLPPLSEQRRIVAYLDSLQAKVDAVKRHQAATRTQLEALLPSILDKAFKGEL
jgi:type I restriction enzyme S subunit